MLIGTEIPRTKKARGASPGFDLAYSTPMLDSSDIRLGYCTNVHAGHDFDSTIANLQRYAVAARHQLGLNGPLDIGLWLSAEALNRVGNRALEFRDALTALNLRVFTFNGFPYGDFHEPVVKHRVYEPSWADESRLHYTLSLIAVLGTLTDQTHTGSISTVPIGWPDGGPCKPVDLDAAAVNLRVVADVLATHYQQTGRLIHLDLEPEPGCILSTSDDVVTFWEQHLLTDCRSEHAIREHLRVCHDICHAAVMFEDQTEVFAKYTAAGIQVGKVQISSAVRAELHSPQPEVAAMEALRTFVEPRYLHQTTVRLNPTTAHNRNSIAFFEDLPLALQAMSAGSAPVEARVHFHIPIFMNALGLLGTTQNEIEPAIRAALAAGVEHFEVETYAWNVLPRSAAGDLDLATGIAHELRYAATLMNSLLR